MNQPCRVVLGMMLAAYLLLQNAAPVRVLQQPQTLCSTLNQCVDCVQAGLERLFEPQVQ